MVISLLLQDVSALKISLDSPSKAEINKEFKVSISADSTEKHDVKIFIHNSDDSKIERNEYISEIKYDAWKDSYFYIKESFPKQTEYIIRAISSPGTRQICARLRKTGTSSYSTACNEIEIISSPSQKNSEEKFETQKIEKTTKQEDFTPQVYSQTPTIQKNSEEKFAPKSEKIIEQGDFNSQEFSQQQSSEKTDPLFLSSAKDEKIVLNSKKLEPKKESTFITKEGIKIKYIFYGFFGFCILIIVVLALKKL